MTQTDFALLVLLFVLLAGFGVWQWITTPPEYPPPAEPEPFTYEPEVHSRGAKLPTRPEGMASLKAEIAKAPKSTVHVERSVLIGLPADGFEPTPAWRPKPRKTPEWVTTDEHKFAELDFFADQPDDQAVQRKWTGTGLRVRGAMPTVGEVDDEWAYELLAPAVAR